MGQQGAECVTHEAGERENCRQRPRAVLKFIHSEQQAKITHQCQQDAGGWPLIADRCGCHCGAEQQRHGKQCVRVAQYFVTAFSEQCRWHGILTVVCAISQYLRIESHGDELPLNEMDRR